MAYTGLIVLTGIMMYLLFDKYIEIAGELKGAIEAARQVLELTQDTLASVDNIKSGSGLRPS